MRSVFRIFFCLAAVFFLVSCRETRERRGHETLLLSGNERLWQGEDGLTEGEMALEKRLYGHYVSEGPDGTLQISAYDRHIKAEAERIGWDWRLLAAIIYHESRFNPQLKSRKGAYGLMQLMPVIMQKYHIDDTSSIEEHLEAGGKLLQHLDCQIPESVADSAERQYFILGAYNAGLGQVKEARQKAEAAGRDPDVWTGHVDHYLPRQTCRFVREVSKRYSHYKNLIE